MQYISQNGTDMSTCLCVMVELKFSRWDKLCDHSLWPSQLFFLGYIFLSSVWLIDSQLIWNLESRIKFFYIMCHTCMMCGMRICV